MGKGIERSREQQGASWRVVLSAWALVLVILILSAGFHAVASLRGGAPPEGRLVGAVVPRHDPACGGPGMISAQPAGACGAPLSFSEDRSAYW